jgi:cobalt-zinc-cadmium efflux system outer membrane protein
VILFPDLVCPSFFMKQNCFCSLSLAMSMTLGIVMAISVRGQETVAMPGRNSTEALSLEMAVRLAMENNPEIHVLAADVSAAQGEATAAKTWENPEISVAPGYKQFRESSDKQFHADFGLEQTFEWPGKRTLRRAIAEKNIAERKLALDGFRSQLAIQVRRAYLNLMVAHEVVTLRERRQAIARSFVEAARKKVEAGFAPEFEATKAEVEVVSAQKALREALAQHDAARFALNTLMGRRSDDPLAIVGKLDMDAAVPDQMTLLEKALTQNPAVKIQEAEVERTGLSLQSVRKSRMPDFKAGPSVEFTRDEQIIGFGVSLPLPLWNNKKGEVAIATAGQQKALAELEKLRREILCDVTTAAENLAAEKDALAYYTPALREKLQAALEVAGQSYSEGRTPLLLYLEAQRTYFDTQVAYFETMKNILEARAELESAVGVPLDQFSQTQPQ